MDTLKITKSSIIRNRKHYLALRTFLENRGNDFIIKQCGSIDTLFFRDTKYISVNVKDMAGKGHHLSKMVNKDVCKWLELNGDKLQQHQSNYREQLFNIAAIEKVIGQPCVAIDVNDCYWKTIYKLGYITEKTYIVGKRKKEWKMGRNTSIGALAKIEVEIPYIAGKIKTSLKKVKHPPIQHQYIRNHIINYVYELFRRLHQEIGDNFLMFLTDCVYTNYDKLRYIENFFDNAGYKVKSKPIEFTELDRKQKIVKWKDFHSSRNNGNKYYMFADHQVID